MSSVILVTGSYDRSVKFWEATTGLCYHTIPHVDTHINKLTSTHSKELLAAGGKSQIKIYHIRNNSTPLLRALDGHSGNVVDLHFSEDDCLLFSASEDKSICLWDIRQKPKFYKRFKFKNPVNSMDLHPINQSEIVSGEENGSIKLFDLSQSSKEPIFKHTPKPKVPIRSVSISSDGKKCIAVNNIGDVFIYNLQENKNNKNINKNKINKIKNINNNNNNNNINNNNINNDINNNINNNNNNIDTDDINIDDYVDDLEDEDEEDDDDDDDDNDESENCLNSTSFKLKKQFKAHDGFILKSSISPNSKQLATTSSDHTVKLWNIENNECKLENTLKGHKGWVWDCCYSSDSEYLVTCSSDCEVRLYEVKKSGNDPALQYKGHKKAVVCCHLNDLSQIG